VCAGKRAVSPDPEIVAKTLADHMRPILCYQRQQLNQSTNSRPRSVQVMQGEKIPRLIQKINIL
jgi:hypothetical protein